MTLKRFLWAVWLAPLCVTAAGKKPPPPSPEYLVGEASAELLADPAVAREQAQARALGDLARQARVSVRSALVDVMGQSSDKTETRLESRIDAVADMENVRLDRVEFFPHYPRRKWITCRVSVNRSRYDEEIRQALHNRQETVHRRVQTAFLDARAGRWAAALEMANTALGSDDTAEGDRQTAREILHRLSSTMRLNVSDRRVATDSMGKYAEPVTAWVSGGKKANREGIPLEARWSFRPDPPAEIRRTDAHGRAVFRPTVDPFRPSATLLITPQGLSAPALRVEFQRRKETVLFVDGPRGSLKESVQDLWLSRLRARPGVVRLAQRVSDRGERTFTFVIRISTRRHPNGNIFQTFIRTELERQEEGGTITQRGPSADGYGSNRDNAEESAERIFLTQFSHWLSSLQI